MYHVVNMMTAIMTIYMYLLILQPSFLHATYRIINTFGFAILKKIKSKNSNEKQTFCIFKTKLSLLALKM